MKESERQPNTNRRSAFMGLQADRERAVKTVILRGVRSAKQTGESDG